MRVLESKCYFDKPYKSFLPPCDPTYVSVDVVVTFKPPHLISAFISPRAADCLNTSFNMVGGMAELCIQTKAATHKASVPP